MIDLYQMHWPDPVNDIEEAWEEMVRLKEEGKVRHIGVCNYNVEQLERIGRIHPAASLQPPYSMIRREVEKDLLGYCGSTTSASSRTARSSGACSPANSATSGSPPWPPTTTAGAMRTSRSRSSRDAGHGRSS